jgi:putative transcriptional regulator
MIISYNKLWKLLVDKKMSKAALRKAADIAPNTMTRLRRDREVKLSVLFKICSVLHADIGDIMEFQGVHDEEKRNHPEFNTL